MKALFTLLAALTLCAAPAAARKPRGPKLPDAEDLLRKVMQSKPPAYEGRVVVETFLPKLAPPKEMDVRFVPPGKYRRETLDEKGEPAQVVVSDGSTEWIYDKAKSRVWSGEPPDPDYKQLGRDDESDLLEANYEAAVSTGEAVAGRSTWLLELRSREGGAVGRRLWVDRRNGLILRAQVFEPEGGLTAETRFEEVKFTKRQKKSFFTFTPPPGAAVVKRLEPDFMALDQAKSASGLEPKTPGWLPSGYVFESLDVLQRGGKNIIHYRFSDGINVLSLFQCPPRVTLDFGGKPGERVLLGSGRGTLAWTPEGRVLGWSAGRSKFVLVGAVPPETLEKIADSVR
jgi:outer membrane lipoprotein-sorting protein